MNVLRLPELVATYFALPSAADPTSLEAVFADDAVVRDERQEHRGVAAIRAWRADTMARTPFTARPLSAEEKQGVLAVPAEVTGSFPGSPLVLVHRFTVRDGRVARLEIG